MATHMCVLGVHVFDPDRKPSPHLIYCLTVILMQPYLSYNAIFIHKNSPDALTESLSISATSTQVFARAYFYIFQRALCRSLVDNIRQQRVLFGADEDPEVEEVFARNADRMWMFYHLLHGSYLSALSFVVMAAVMPDPKKFGLPLAFHFPFLPLDNPVWWYFTYFHHAAMIFVAVHLLLIIDGTMMISMISVSARIQALKVLLRRLDEKIQSVPWYKTHALESELNRIIELHESIKEFARQINRSFTIHFFAIFATICLVICMCLNVIAISPKSSVYPFLGASTSQLFVMCFFGNILVIENDSLSTDIYSVQWYRMTVSQQKKIMFMIANAQPDIKVGTVFMLANMTTFVTVVRAAYSYFTILQ
ncbi:odorant receptor 4-like [Anopheles darlingi]|uniref:odorant receptor 4-like n=1 Tax=Anopheles darlingi TaxID=43151 RepID=UPI0021000583|nr:odorant receptor 4-like [Anopheles darlingi]